MGSNKLKSYVGIGEYKEYEFRYDVNQDKVRVTISKDPPETKEFDNVDQAKRFIDTLLRKLKARDPVKVPMLVVLNGGRVPPYQVDKNAPYIVMRVDFVGHHAGTGRARYRIPEQDHTFNDEGIIKHRFPYVPGYSESLAAPIAAAMNSCLIADQHKRTLLDGLPTLQTKGQYRTMHDQQLKMPEGNTYGGRKIGTTVAFRWDLKVKEKAELWTEFYMLMKTGEYHDYKASMEAQRKVEANRNKGRKIKRERL